MTTVAALYVATGGCYFDLDGVDPWDATRDARLYAGPWPVVAHPPCSRWCRLAGLVEARWGHKRGEDGGCFAAALAAVRKWGGVLEHPAYSDAWAAHGLKAPRRSGWWRADSHDGWTCAVEQGAYGHRAKKATWLYAVGVELPPLKWTPLKGDTRLYPASRRERRRLTKTVAGMTPEQKEARRAEVLGSKDASGYDWCCPEVMGKHERLATPLPFRDLLLSIARSAHARRGAA